MAFYAIPNSTFDAIFENFNGFRCSSTIVMLNYIRTWAIRSLQIGDAAIFAAYLESFLF